LSPQLAALDDRVLLLQEFRRSALDSAAAKSEDALYGWTEGGPAELWMVNGVEQPTLTMKGGEWKRLRLIMAGVSEWIHLDFAACDAALLAKDGIYISDFPRFVSHVSLPPGGRADVVVRCPAADHADAKETHIVASQAGVNVLKKPLLAPLFGLRVTSQSASGLASEDLRAWSPPLRPRYLQDLTAQSKPECSCATMMGVKAGGDGNSKWINNHLYSNAKNYMHSSARDAVVERRLGGISKHSYHQHTWPFQLMQGSYGDTDYFKAGDWHDTYYNAWNDSAVVRYTTSDFHGSVVLHCHALSHTDGGMLAVEVVGNGAANGTCGCDLLDSQSATALATTAIKLSAPRETQTQLLLGAVGLFIAMVSLTTFGACHLVRTWRSSDMATNYASLSAGPTGSLTDVGSA